MEKRYSGIGELLKYDQDALHYFESLPLNIREKIAPLGAHVNSFQELIDRAESIKLQMNVRT